jgi:hypothetical protein
MAYATFSTRLKKVANPSLSELDRLPYGLFEITADSVVVDYIPFKSQIASNELPQVCGKNLLENILSSEVFREFRETLPALRSSSETKKSWMISLPSFDRYVRISIVASKNQHSPRMRISLAKLLGSETPRVRTFLQ